MRDAELTKLVERFESLQNEKSQAEAAIAPLDAAINKLLNELHQASPQAVMAAAGGTSEGVDPATQLKLAEITHMRTQRDVLPGIIRRIENQLTELSEKVFEQAEAVLREIRTQARLQCEKLEAEIIADKTGTFGGDMERAKVAALAVREKSESNRWYRDLPRKADAFGSPSEAARRVLLVRKAFADGVALTKAFRDSMPAQTESRQNQQQRPKPSSLERKAARAAAAEVLRKQDLSPLGSKKEVKVS